MNHVLIDCERTKYPNTGLYHFCLQLGRELIKQADPHKEQLSFYVPKSQQLFGQDQQYVFQHPLHKFYQAGTGRFDVWHSTFQNSDYRPYHSSTRVLLTVHDLNFLVERNKEPHKIKKYLRKLRENVHRAQSIVCISEYAKDVLLQHVPVNNIPARIIYNGCNINEFPGFDTPAYRPARPFIFSLGTVLPKKNFHVLPALLKNNDYDLIISGVINKEYKTTIEAAAAKHGVAGRVILTGPVSEEDKYWYYKNCAAFAFPSLAEGFGLPVIEAMYFGKPVFLSRLTSLPEVGGTLAYYFNSFDPADMQAAFDSGMKHYAAAHPQEAIHRHAMRFSWQQAAAQYLGAYRELYNK